MYWTGGSCLGLLVKDNKDIRYMYERVRMHNNFNEYENEDDYLEYYLGGKRMWDDSYEGCWFRPFKGESCYIDQDFPVFFFECAKLSGYINIIKHGFYKSESEVVDEFKESLGAYLPDDFDYNAAIGEMSFAVYG